MKREITEKLKEQWRIASKKLYHKKRAEGLKKDWILKNTKKP